MVVVSNIDGELEVEELQAGAAEALYGDEVLSANLMPQVAVQVAEFAGEVGAYVGQQVKRAAMPASLALTEVEAFMIRMYAAQE